jgi:hypothetical protein
MGPIAPMSRPLTAKLQTWDDKCEHFMDPKALSHLDPKQREAYERVMGTAAEIHADPAMNTPADTSEPSILSNEDPFAQTPASTPFDTSVGGLSSPQSVDTPAPSSPDQIGVQSGPADMGSTDLSAPVSTPAAPPSIFTNSASEPDPTQLSNPIDSAVAPNSAFFTNTPVPPPADTTTPSPEAESTPDLASADGFPPVQSTPESTIPSDNLSSVTPTPYNPDAADATSAVMPQPFNTQPLPSPAEVGAATQHEASPLLRVLYIVGAVVFFAIYTIFWIKIFNLPFIF